MIETTFNTRRSALGPTDARRAIAGVLVGALSFALFLGCAMHAQTAWGAELASASQLKIDSLTQAVSDAEGKVSEAAAAADQHRAKIAELEGQITAQRERSYIAARNLYKLQKDKFGIVEALLQSKNINDFIKQVDYFERVSQGNIRELTKLNNLHAQMQEELRALEEETSRAQDAVEEARAELKRAQKVRADKQKSGQQKALSQDKSSALKDGADWYSSEEEFINEWAPRIDKFLAGSPTAGCGKYYAKAAWDYCIDPRYSPAISYIESGKGAKCIRAHNAWGWGASEPNPKGNAAEWGSWEEAINAHCKGLANGYGYTLTKSAAKKYCPGNEGKWYSTVLSGMKQI